MKIRIRKARRSDARAFLSLVDALAEYEKLARPTPAARKRLIRDGFTARRRFDPFIVTADGTPAGYAIIFETYSSFLARPTLYLEDLFVLPEFRSYGIGRALFRYCLNEAKRRRCGRMEWCVLDWNMLARRFYKKLGAKHMRDWLIYRIVLPA